MPSWLLLLLEWLLGSLLLGYPQILSFQLSNFYVLVTFSFFFFFLEWLNLSSLTLLFLTPCNVIRICVFSENMPAVCSITSKNIHHRHAWGVAFTSYIQWPGWPLRLYNYVRARYLQSVLFRFHTDGYFCYDVCYQFLFTLGLLPKNDVFKGLSFKPTGFLVLFLKFSKGVNKHNNFSVISAFITKLLTPKLTFCLCLSAVCFDTVLECRNVISNTVMVGRTTRMDTVVSYITMGASLSVAVLLCSHCPERKLRFLLYKN